MDIHVVLDVSEDDYVAVSDFHALAAVLVSGLDVEGDVLELTGFADESELVARLVDICADLGGLEPVATVVVLQLDDIVIADFFPQAVMDLLPVLVAFIL